ncbi:hypothetical protein BKA65DRAFT_549916 [Rhexocercosporidium sp. MPI-PUGE-AT-0058]|nr:hypothetical protein BKA65DRAFT_549916 [Rhexocercosporidium sp. MPI-PUGE-AT-0058]
MYGGPEFWLHKCATTEDGEAVKGADVKARAKDNGTPRERPQYPNGHHCAYVLDLEGNNIECAYYQPLWLSALQLAPSVLGAGAIGALAWWNAEGRIG